ncbi:MAG TPA: LptE family protein [Candidatus Cloacimonadota bacterium]|nr:LptE family protein [Candidatus Cloacimonadota bacterium]HOD53370.1 LptE family protein [Candidatus Cloacimonadota bacterium]HPM01226.1 LptE family protein [Candidatus Cloacimonadota bacterium]
MVKNFYYIFLLLLLFAGCSYSVYTSEYPHLKTIYIQPFENKTVEYALAQDTQNSLVNAFLHDGRLKINTQNPDSELKGEIIDYKKKIFSYDNAGNVQEYQIQILFSVTFTDLKMSKTIYENKSLLLTKTYNPSSTNVNIEKTEEEAINKIFSDLFDHIIKNTLESW